MDKKLLVTLAGALFLAIGLLGFVQQPVLELFAVDFTHNLIHLGSGMLAFILLAKGFDGAVLYGKIMTVVYGLVTVLGLLLVGQFGELFGIVQMNTADHFLHLGLTALFAYIGFVPSLTDSRASM